MLVKVYDKQAQEVNQIEVSENVFGVEFKESLIHQVVVAQLANKRQGTKSALTRTEVSGGGKKPWRQKGTGNARQGSTRAPQWIHGGVVFAPKPRDFSQKINKAMNRGAILSALSEKVRDEEFKVVDTFELLENKTKHFAKVVKAFGFKKTLVVVDDDDQNTYVVARNIKNVDIINVNELNVYDLVSHVGCLCSEKAVKAINAKYSEEE